MKVEYWLFGSGIFFFTPVAFIYGYFSNWEGVGTTGLFLTAGLSAMIGGYLWVTARHIDPRPEDDSSAEVDEGAGEQGFYSPHSWWPLAAASGAALLFAGLAVGLWVALIGVAVSALAVVGWVYEYYRGEHAH